MRTEDYFRSISQELESVRDRVRYMIDDAHWPTDGELKESVLRTLIRRSAPTTVSVGRGFVVGRDSCTSQLDILIHDNSHPVLYRDGDLVFVSPSACLAIIEVKSRVNGSTFSTACAKLANDAAVVRSKQVGSSAFVGLFSYDAHQIGSARILGALDEATNGDGERVIDHVAIGSDKFIKWWLTSPIRQGEDCRSWHLYNLRSMAAGYFIHNLLMHLSPLSARSGETAWFPSESKEVRLVDQRRIRDA